MSNIVTVTILANRFDPAKEGCPAVVDPFGLWEATFPSHPPPYPGPYPEPFVAMWGQWLNRANDVVLVGAKSGDTHSVVSGTDIVVQKQLSAAVLPTWLCTSTSTSAMLLRPAEGSDVC